MLLNRAFENASEKKYNHHHPSWSCHVQQPFKKRFKKKRERERESFVCMYVCIWDLGSVPCNHVYALQKKEKRLLSPVGRRR